MNIVYALCVDGPAAGEVCEVALSDRMFYMGRHRYRRFAWGNDKAHRIAHFTYVGSLVV